ncbi:MAG: SAM-dependent chlorinase/fluorinase [Chloroflexi bacterium]|nr:SAM-dependent chlorinase/fluorinase [Chloroflexota bacterium]
MKHQGAVRGVITLTTDFGPDDVYAGVVRGVILKINPDAVVVDLCHGVNPQNVLQAGFLLDSSHPYFPLDSIHLAVVDPGVGTARKAVIVNVLHPPFTFLAPDNGLLSYVLARHIPRVEHKLANGRVSLQGLEEHLQAFEITNARFWLHPVSATFHGRDVFAPVAAHLSLGRSPAAFGPPARSLVYLPPLLPVKGLGGVLRGQVMHVDRFGNLITNFKQGDLPGEAVTIELGGQRVKGIGTAYAGGEDVLALVGSSGYLEIAVRDASAAKVLNAGIGDEVVVTP